MAAQDVCGAIGFYGKVLELDADYAQAQLERQKAVDLKTRLGTTKC